MVMWLFTDRPMGKTVYLTPALVIGEADLDQLCRAVRLGLGVSG